jgi:hypothetical protein
MNLGFLKPNFEESSKPNKNRKGRDISKYLWIILIIIMFSERALARYRKQ